MYLSVVKCIILNHGCFILKCDYIVLKDNYIILKKHLHYSEYRGIIFLIQTQEVFEWLK